ncbi:hypothetical protein BDF20DRAFT_812747 [Mycotypha africana]|uniref:uncharacterized protein n=1 Tax=Mycotypha africana TaxID=64632 RepID=UPI00230096A1|nr:uncharacterized protein BDF20DRAFT_812747 [Mycotypha africana]KAI8991689.1 hypothetical protein BDF20DRAFT_812747 [Mycotypha africana]
MYLRIILFICSLSFTVRYVHSLKALEITQCPKLAPREPAKSVFDLRPDDIEVIAGMGDSVSAGLLDADAQSLPAYIRQYQSKLMGASIGKRPAEICPDTFFCTSTLHSPKVDQLNAAQSGATTRELPEQVAYLKQYIGQGTALASKWKLINFYMGYNDGSVSCLPGRNEREYWLNVRNALNDLITSIDYTFINLIGLTHYSEVVDTVRTTAPAGYKKTFPDGRNDLSSIECYCCSQPNGGVNYISERVTGYNKALQLIAEEIQKTTTKNVTAVYQPTSIISSSVPYFTFR